MAKMKRLIFKVNNLEKKYGSISALDLKKLDIHPGTIYGIVGNVGSGKSSLLNILAGAEKESSGTVLYEDNKYKKSWLGKIQTPDDIFYTKSLSLNTPNSSVSSYIADKFGKKKNIIKNRYFKDGSFKNLWSRNLKSISKGEAVDFYHGADTTVKIKEFFKGETGRAVQEFYESASLGDHERDNVKKKFNELYTALGRNDDNFKAMLAYCYFHSVFIDQSDFEISCYLAKFFYCPICNNFIL